MGKDEQDVLLPQGLCPLGGRIKSRIQCCKRIFKEMLLLYGEGRELVSLKTGKAPNERGI